ncbi:MAG: transposase, partial [Bacteroidales bacterium]|nr:transposase [Bacteroidales bacterium]
EQSGIDSFHTIMDTIHLHYDEILNYYLHRSTNASAEQLNSTIKAFRKSLRGVQDLKFFFFRLSKIYA